MPPRIYIFGQEVYTKEINLACLGHRSGKVYATASPDRILYLWSVYEKNPIQQYGPFNSNITALTFNFQEDQIALGTQEGYVTILDLEESKTIMSWSPDDSRITAIAIHPTSSNYVAVGDINGKIKIFSTEYQMPIQQYFITKAQINTIKFCPQGRILAVAGMDSQIHFFDILSGVKIGVFVDNVAPITCIDFHPEEQILISCAQDRSIHVYNLYSDEIFTSYLVGHSTPTTIKFSLNGSTFAAFSEAAISIFSTASITTVDHFMTPNDGLIDANLFDECVETICGGKLYPSISIFDSKTFRVIESELTEEKKTKKRKKKKKLDPYIYDQGNPKKVKEIYKQFRSSRAEFLATISRKQNAHARMCEMIRSKGVKGMVKEVGTKGECSLECLQLLNNFKMLNNAEISLDILCVARFCLKEDLKLSLIAIRSTLASCRQIDKQIESVMHDIAPRIVESTSHSDEIAKILSEIIERWPNLIK
ncbi:hypothetical protein TVAG_397060 [Trichomonas vaginalis G3]|uniref:Translation initiation factor beta propellor-like domain-containing protein n=1 Tax=Trichomonas vaginalis (strain ATCC PRA-98 / G3) TaxID=412133 RepID=A2DX94_TRIV3|nr:microtubule severing [Trichomonas vaginalis G3]EAY14976.1 hypothetical protein TVAG_397060 [Trichomonas vaginalis G3]KAI5507351.1 microtubule severing [Trichomonas vaginalis G3]|eukprot:XP_001327199.1 hypothetical protein [Trichomonas vaginalis G3]